MSEAAPEGGGGAAPARAGGGKSTFTRKMGPLPLWAWMGVGLAVVLVYANWQKSKQGASTTGVGSSAGSTSVNSPGGVDASLVPQFINQTYSGASPRPPRMSRLITRCPLPRPRDHPLLRLLSRQLLAGLPVVLPRVYRVGLMNGQVPGNTRLILLLNPTG